MLRFLASAALLAVVVSACSIRPSTAGSNLNPADFYAANPSLADVRTLLGDSNWRPGPPSFGGPPLHSPFTPFHEKFPVIMRSIAPGTAETLDIRDTLGESPPSAT